MKTTCAAGTTIKGVDVSQYQQHVDWKKLISLGIQFGCCKATEGAFFTDKFFQENWVNMKSFNLPRIAYHYFHPSIDPKIQAEHFCKVVGPLLKQDMLMMDWETTDGVPSYSDIENGTIFLNTVEKMTGKRPIIYTGPYFIEALALPPSFDKYLLWVAHYGAKCPLVPLPWKNWTFWQYTDANGLDMDLFNGTLEQLKALTA